MKKLLFFIALLVSISAFSQTAPVLSSSTSEEENTMKIFLAITHNNDAVRSAIKNTLNSMSGANAIAYCNKHALFMVLVDKNTYQSENNFLDQVKKIFPDKAGLLSVKSGDFDAFINYCEPSDSNEAARLKNLSN